MTYGDRVYIERGTMNSPFVSIGGNKLIAVHITGNACREMYFCRLPSSPGVTMMDFESGPVEGLIEADYVLGMAGRAI